MKKPMIIMLLTTAAVLTGIGAVKVRQIQAAVAGAASFQPPPEAVTTVVARPEQWRATLNAIGSVAPVHGVTVSADLPGVVSRIAFDSGSRVRAGDALIELDTRQEQAQLAAARAQENLTRLNFERMRGLRSEGITPQADYDASAAEHEQATARVGEIAATIGRKTILAPFDGVLGIRQVNLGQYLRSGDPVVAVQSLDPIYVDFSVPQQEIAKLKRGAEVRATAEGIAGEAVGQITAVDSVVDEATRNIRVQATFANPAATLRAGMFVEVRVLLEGGSRVVALPASAISYAPYGDSVFVVEPMKGPDGRPYRGVRQTFVRLGPARGDQVAVLTGVAAGDEVVSAGAFKLRNGASVVVNNQTQPSNNPAPAPEDS